MHYTMRKLFKMAQRIKKSDMYSPYGEEPEEEEDEYVPDMPSPGAEMAKMQGPSEAFSPDEKEKLSDLVNDMIVELKDELPQLSGEELGQAQAMVQSYEALRQKVQGMK